MRMNEAHERNKENFVAAASWVKEEMSYGRHTWPEIYDVVGPDTQFGR